MYACVLTHKDPGVKLLWEMPESFEAHPLSTPKGRKWLRVRTISSTWAQEQCGEMGVCYQLPHLFNNTEVPHRLHIRKSIKTKYSYSFRGWGRVVREVNGWEIGAGWVQWPRGLE